MKNNILDGIGENLIRELRCNPVVMREINRSIQAWLDGRVKTLSQVMAEMERKEYG